MTAGPQGTQNSLVAADHSVDIASPHDVTMSACKGISKTSIAADCCLYLTAAIACTESLLRAVTPSEALTKQLLQQLLLNLRLWSSAPADGQLSLQALILKLAKVPPAVYW